MVYIITIIMIIFIARTAKKKPVAGIQDSYSAADEEIQGVAIVIRFVGIMLQISFIILFQMSFIILFQISLKISSLCSIYSLMLFLSLFPIYNLNYQSK